MPDKRKMVKRAKVLEDYQFADFRKWLARNSQMPERDDLIFLLSFRAGLRASEIAKLEVEAMTTSGGQVASVITIHKLVGKKMKSREIPMHPQIADALIRFRSRYPEATCVAIGCYKGKAQMTPNALTVYMWRLLKQAGFQGASSHSGRRTFATKLARRANQFHNSLVDVQHLLGHSRLETTQNYVEPTEEVHAMVASLGTTF